MPESWDEYFKRPAEAMFRNPDLSKAAVPREEDNPDVSKMSAALAEAELAFEERRLEKAARRAAIIAAMNSYSERFLPQKPACRWFLFFLLLMQITWLLGILPTAVHGKKGQQQSPFSSWGMLNSGGDEGSGPGQEPQAIRGHGKTKHHHGSAVAQRSDGKDHHSGHGSGGSGTLPPPLSLVQTKSSSSTEVLSKPLGDADGSGGRFAKLGKLSRKPGRSMRRMVMNADAEDY